MVSNMVSKLKYNNNWKFKNKYFFLHSLQNISRYVKETKLLYKIASNSYKIAHSR